MLHVVFVAPFFRTTTLRFVNAAATLPDIRLGLISQDPTRDLPAELRARIDGHYQVRDGLSAHELVRATRAMQKHFGEVHRLIGTLEQIQIQLGQVRDALQIPGMGEAVARNFRDKARMKDVLRSAGLPCARHTRVTREAEVHDFVARVGLPIILKPLDGAASAGTFRVRNPESLRQALDTLQPSPARPAQAEEFITGEERSFETVMIEGVPVWSGYTRYAPQPLHVLENNWIQWTVLLPAEPTTDELEAIQEPGTLALKTLGMETGLTHLEWFRRQDGSVAISEVAARPPGAQIMTLNSWAYDADFYALWSRLMVHHTWELPPKKYAVGCAFFRAPAAGTISAVHGLDAAQAEVGDLVVESQLPRIGWGTSSSYEGDGYAIVRHPDTAVVEKALHTLISRVKIEVRT